MSWTDHQSAIDQDQKNILQYKNQFKYTKQFHYDLIDFIIKINSVEFKETRF